MRKLFTINNPQENNNIYYGHEIHKNSYRINHPNKQHTQKLSKSNSKNIYLQQPHHSDFVQNSHSLNQEHYIKSKTNDEKLRKIYIGKKNRKYQQIQIPTYKDRSGSRYHSLQDEKTIPNGITKKHKILVSDSQIELIKNKRSQQRQIKAKINDKYLNFLQEQSDYLYQQHKKRQLKATPYIKQRNARTISSHKKFQKRMQFQNDPHKEPPVHTIFNNQYFTHPISQLSNQAGYSSQQSQLYHSNPQDQDSYSQQQQINHQIYQQPTYQKTNFNLNKKQPQQHKKSNQKFQWLPKNYIPHSSLLKTMDFSHFKIKKYKTAVYFGQLDSNKRKEGRGVLFYHNGKSFEGTFHNDQRHGEGVQIYPDNSKFHGKFVQGMKNGKGTFQWSNGEIYQGQWHNNLRNGSGFWKSPTGQSYIGQWKQNRIEGFGVYLSKNGDRYQGEFKNFTKNGQGTQRYSNNDTYVGRFRKNLPNGEGEYFWNNGCYYKGQFCNGLRHGKGIFKDDVNPLKNEQLVYFGYFTNDKKSGYGQLKLINKKKQLLTEYVGNFENDFKHGFGQMATYELDENGKPKFLKEILRGYWMNDVFFEEDSKRQQQLQVINISTIPEQVYPQKQKKSSKLHMINNTIPKKPLYRSLDRSPYKVNNYLKPIGCSKIH